MMVGKQWIKNWGSLGLLNEKCHSCMYVPLGKWHSSKWGWKGKGKDRLQKASQWKVIACGNVFLEVILDVIGLCLFPYNTVPTYLIENAL